MEKKLLIFAAGVLLLCVASGSAQTRRSAQIKRINSYVKQLEKYVGRRSGKFEVYANISTNEKDKWHKFPSDRSLDKFRESHEADEIAYVWRKNGEVVAVNFTFTSESGDWAHYVFHRYRPDGTLAKVDSDLRTFYGDLSVQRSFYYDARGKLLSKHTEYRDISTNKRKKPDENFYDEKVHTYKTTAKLPFVALLGNKGRK